LTCTSSRERYVKGKLEDLPPAQLGKLKESFIKNKHPRFRKEIAACRHTPYGTIKLYREGIENADLDRLAKLIKIVGVLLQKVYLFWGKPEGRCDYDNRKD
jgi:hypothetical protein